MEHVSGGQSIWACLSPASDDTLVYKPFMDQKFIIGTDRGSVSPFLSEGDSNTLSGYTSYIGVGYGEGTLQPLREVRH